MWIIGLDLDLDLDLEGVLRDWSLTLRVAFELYKFYVKKIVIFEQFRGIVVKHVIFVKFWDILAIAVPQQAQAGKQD